MQVFEFILAIIVWFGIYKLIITFIMAKYGRKEDEYSPYLEVEDLDGNISIYKYETKDN